jgi:alpha-glucosidase
LEWHLHAAPEVHGRLYEDVGDGYGDSRLTVVEGRLEAGAFKLTRRVEGRLPLTRTEETIRVYGLPYASGVTGAKSFRFERGVLEMRVVADWTELSVAT